ncbi:MAG: hypothetical protein ACXVQJ_00485 [Actinomycetota bacterium]
MLAIVPFMLVFRFLHIVSGILWVGSAFLFVGFIGPSAAEVGPSAGPLLHAAVKRRKVSKVITALGATTVLAGWVMWLRDMRDYGGFHDWVTTSFGAMLSIGAILATGAFFMGYMGVGRNVEKMVDLSDQIAASGGPPTPEQGTQMQHLGAELKKHGQIDLVMLLLAVSAMATARYW